MTALPAPSLVEALAWIKAEGSLTDFPCHDSAIPALLRGLTSGCLIKRRRKGLNFDVTPAGDALLAGQGIRTSPARCWIGWAVDVPGRPLHVEYGADEAETWRHALGWPDEEEIAHAKAQGARAFPVQITERSR